MDSGVSKEKSWAIANHMAKMFQVKEWRDKIREEEETAKWAYIFDKVEPDMDKIIDCAAIIIRATGVTGVANWLVTIATVLWTYGYAQALTDLANEDITLFEGQPLDFPWDTEPPTILPDERDDSGAVGVTTPTPPTTPPTNTQAALPTGGTYDYGFNE